MKKKILDELVFVNAEASSIRTSKAMMANTAEVHDVSGNMATTG
jgi:hypothetical protein